MKLGLLPDDVRADALEDHKELRDLLVRLILERHRHMCMRRRPLFVALFSFELRGFSCVGSLFFGSSMNTS